MTTYRADVTIAAPPARVWAVLVDFPRYPEWNPFTIAVSTSLKLGGPVDMQVVLNGRCRRQREVLRGLEVERLLCWGTVMGAAWLLWAERRQTLEPVAEGTRYISEDRIEGLLEPVVRWLYAASLEQGFTAMAHALKLRAEA